MERRYRYHDSCKNKEKLDYWDKTYNGGYRYERGGLFTMSGVFLTENRKTWEALSEGVLLPTFRSDKFYGENMFPPEKWQELMKESERINRTNQLISTSEKELREYEINVASAKAARERSTATVSNGSISALFLESIRHRSIFCMTKGWRIWHN